MTNTKAWPPEPKPQPEPALTPDQKLVQAMARDPRLGRVMTDSMSNGGSRRNQPGEVRGLRPAEQRKELGREGNSPMSVLGYCEPSNCTELWREKAITERAFALINAEEWPPPVGWLDDLLSRDWIPPEGDFWETVRRERRSVRLICKDGNRVA
jgi:hypothetical protein